MIVTTRRKVPVPPVEVEPLSERVTVYLTPTEKTELRRQARAAGATMSAFCRPKLIEGD